MRAWEIRGPDGVAGLYLAQRPLSLPGTVNPTPLKRKSVRLQGVYVGIRAAYQRMRAPGRSGKLVVQE